MSGTNGPPKVGVSLHCLATLLQSRPLYFREANLILADSFSIFFFFLKECCKRVNFSEASKRSSSLARVLGKTLIFVVFP